MDSRLVENTESQCELNNFSLEKYFLTIGWPDFSPSVSLFTLTKIVEHHLLYFNYQSTELFEAGKVSAENRKIPSLDINDLFKHMLGIKGGYCFQHLELLYAVLAKVGFNLDRLLAKIILQPCAKIDLSKNEGSIKTHELLIIHLNDTHYLVDVGMANLSLRIPLELKEEIQAINDDLYRLSKVNDVWTLDTKTDKASNWFCMYQFFNLPVKLDDIDKAHTNLYLTEKNINIRDNILLIGKTTLEKRKHLVWNAHSNGPGFFKSIKINSEPKTREFLTLDEVNSCAKAKFGIS